MQNRDFCTDRCHTFECIISVTICARYCIGRRIWSHESPRMQRSFDQPACAISGCAQILFRNIMQSFPIHVLYLRLKPEYKWKLRNILALLSCVHDAKVSDKTATWTSKAPGKLHNFHKEIPSNSAQTNWKQLGACCTRCLGKFSPNQPTWGLSRSFPHHQWQSESETLVEHC